MLREREQHRLNSNVCLQHSDRHRNRVVKLPEVSDEGKNEYGQIAQQTVVAK